MLFLQIKLTEFMSTITTKIRFRFDDEISNFIKKVV